MNTTSNKPSLWNRQVPRWCNWYLLWAALSAIIICPACIYAGSRLSANASAAYLMMAVLLTASFLMSLAALVKVSVKDK